MKIFNDFKIPEGYELVAIHPVVKRLILRDLNGIICFMDKILLNEKEKGLVIEQRDIATCYREKDLDDEYYYFFYINPITIEFVTVANAFDGDFLTDYEKSEIKSRRYGVEAELNPEKMYKKIYLNE